ncbi:type II toxin-antitoxin system RelE/ParE family toxin [Paracandidimonas soli]|uniref:type II toxin-antitoxin system RelE/ParE family toxin n=1 Tax=Paracandidimonas soli TaxID=1917182 RepID=UPI003DA76B21
MQIFKTRGVGRFTRREQIADSSLQAAIERAARGSIDADLGGGLIKQRVARLGQGRSGGFRMIIAYREATRAVFLYGLPRAILPTSAMMNCEPYALLEQTGLQLRQRSLGKR